MVVSLWYGFIGGIGLAAFNLSVIPRRYRWVLSAFLIALRIWLLGDITRILLFSSFTNDPMRAIHWDTLNDVMGILIAHAVFCVIQHGLADTIHYYSHYLGFLLFIVWRPMLKEVPLALFYSLGAFDVTSFMYSVAPTRAKGLGVITFAMVRVLSYAFMMFSLERGKVILSLVLTCQIWILYILVMQFATKETKKTEKKEKRKKE